MSLVRWLCVSMYWSVVLFIPIAKTHKPIQLKPISTNSLFKSNTEEKKKKITNIKFKEEIKKNLNSDSNNNIPLHTNLFSLTGFFFSILWSFYDDTHVLKKMKYLWCTLHGMLIVIYETAVILFACCFSLNNLFYFKAKSSILHYLKLKSMQTI